MNLTTSIIHSIPTDPLTGAIAVPIYQTSTFVQQEPGINKGYEYARSKNPTREALEKILAAIEHGTSAAAFSSGLAAIDAIVKLLEYGDEIIAIDDIYGGAFRMFDQVYKKFGVKVQYVDPNNHTALKALINRKTKLIWIETPSNPSLKIVDITAISKIAQEFNLLLCVDNTFASPVLQNPLNLGADIVVHSVTKYLSGHSDLIAGAVITKDESLGEKIKFIQNATGAILAPQDCFLTIRGIETLALRIEKHCSNAQFIADALYHHPLISKVYYPGLPTHPNHDVAKKQLRGFGGMISVELKNNSIEAAKSVVSKTKLFQLAESLGGVKSLIAHPASMTHKSIPEHIRLKNGISNTLIRLSVGIEDANDLLEDIQQALN
jgi:cystathionine beta-lyase